MDVAEFCVGKTKQEELEKLLHRHKGNSIIAVIRAEKLHIAVHGAYTSYQNNGDAIVFYHDGPDNSKKELFSLIKGDFCYVGPIEKINLKLDEYRNKWLKP